MRILAADDDPINRRLLQATLEKWGHEVVLAADGTAALEILRSETRPLLAILDWMMPGMSGPDVCAELRLDVKLRGSYVILLTARDAREDVVSGLDRGADDFMTKPFDRDILRARVSVGERVLGLQQALSDSNARLAEHGDRLETAVALRTAELRLAHRELTAAGQLKDRVLSCVHHELRTPVTKLLSIGQTLERVKPGTSAPPAMLSTLVQQTKHLAGLLDQVLSVRALMGSEDGQGGEPAMSAELGTTVEAVVFCSQAIAASRRVVLEVEKDWPVTRVAAEASSLTLVLSPILDNAMKFTDAGTRVRIGCSLTAPDRVRVTITDEGPGVRPEDRERIFAEFDQGSADPLVAKPAGLGLGLAIARRLARRMGGDIGIGPGPSDRGAVFWVELPLVLEGALVLA